MIVYSHKSDCRDFLTQYFTLRKNIFCDRHGWVKANGDGTETDELDEGECHYILFVEPGTNKTLGGMRMVPTTGRTLIHAVWPDMLPEPNDFRSPVIWEITRFCVLNDTSSEKIGGFVNKAGLALMFAVFEFAAELGVSLFIAICHDRLVRMFDTFGFSPEIISTKVDDDGQKIHCVLWSTGEELRAKLRRIRRMLPEGC